jgi:hypothetical protein
LKAILAAPTCEIRECGLPPTATSTVAIGSDRLTSTPV